MLEITHVDVILQIDFMLMSETCDVCATLSLHCLGGVNHYVENILHP